MFYDCSQWAVSNSGDEQPKRDLDGLTTKKCVFEVMGK